MASILATSGFVQYFGFRSNAGNNNTNDSVTAAASSVDGTNPGVHDDDADGVAGLSPRRLTMSEQLFGRKDTSNHGSTSGTGVSHSPTRSRHRHPSMTSTELPAGKTSTGHRFSIRSDASNNSLSAGAGLGLDDSQLTVTAGDLGSPTGMYVYVCGWFSISFVLIDIYTRLFYVLILLFLMCRSKHWFRLCDSAAGYIGWRFYY